MTYETVGVVGYGYVGKAVAKFFKDNFQVKAFDPLYEAGEKDGILFTKEHDDINACDLVVVCVPTPEGADGSVDLSYIKSTFEWLNAPAILIKSTVPPGTTDRIIAGEFGKWIDLPVAFSPEYIGEGGYVVPWWKDRGYPHPTDMKFHGFHIFGGKKSATSRIIPFFQKVTGPDAKYIQTDTKTAELTKYMFNSWGATKVTFCNEFYNIAEAMGVDYNELRELLLLDGRMEAMHTAVFPDKRGFGGKCFPKDVRGIVEHSTKNGYNPELLREVLNSNQRIKKPFEGKH